MVNSKVIKFVFALHNLKANYFKTELNKKDFKVKLSAISNDLKLINIYCPEEKIEELNLLYSSLSTIFKNLN